MQTNKKRKHNASQTYDQINRHDEMALVPTNILAEWVTDRGRCLWESTAAGPVPWSGNDEDDRQLAARICGGCPVLAICLELEARTEQECGGHAWNAVHPLDRAVLEDVWTARFRPDVQATLTDEDGAEQ